MKRSSWFTRCLVAAGLFSLGLAAARAGDPRVGLLSYWPLEALNGTTVSDAWFTNHLTVFGSPTTVAGQFGNALAFSGSSQYLSLTHSYDNTVSGLPLYNSPNGYTVCFWVKGAAQTAKYIFAEGSTTNTNPLLLLQTGQAAANNNKLDVYIRTTGGGQQVNHYISMAPVFDNTWHHVGFVDTKGNIQIYIDGNADTNFTYSAGALALNTTSIGANVRSGHLNGEAFFNGSLDEVAVWPRTLSQAEIQQVKNSGITLVQTPVIDQQPASGTNHLGDYIRLSVAAYGPPPLAYQWFKNSAPLQDRTNATLPIFDTSVTSSNVYSVIVSNSFGSVTSTLASVVIVDDGPADLTAGIVSYWPMDAVTYGATTNTPDIYYNHADLVLSNMDESALVLPGNPLFPALNSNSLSFNILGSYQYGQRAGGTPIYNTTNYTVAFWVYGYAAQHNMQLFAEGNAAGNFFLIGTENSAPYGGLLNVKVSPGLGDHKSTHTVLDNTWHHVVWVDENGKAALYIDGVLDDTDFGYTRSNIALQTTAMGALYRSSAANFFTGILDDVAMWNRRLSYTEIQQLITSGIPQPNIVAPVITQQPLGSTNHAGDRFTLTVVATGTAPSYQWCRDGVPLSGATTTSLTLLPTTAVVNDYTVVVTNIAGAVTSAVAHVVILADPAPDLRAGLWYYWPLDTLSDAFPTNTPDLYSGVPMVLTNMDASNLFPGRAGNALYFTDAQQSGFAQRSGSVPIYLLTNYTISFWVNGSAGQFNKQVFAEGGTSGNFFLLGTENVTSGGGHLDVKVNPGMNDRVSTRTVFDDSWHHVVWVDENGQGKLYIDGALDETDFTYTRAASISLQSTTLGALLRATPANYFLGFIDEVAVWNRRLSWTEIGQLESSGIPARLAAVPPTIFTQPVDQTNGVFATDQVSFSVVATGTTPNYQWWCNGAPLAGVANASATNGTLVLPGVRTIDAGSYWVVVSNDSGAVTSSVVQLTVIPYTPVTTGEALKLDLDAVTPLGPALQAGFTEMTLALNGTNFRGVKVTFSPLATVGSITLADRDRTGQTPSVTNNPPLLTQAQLYNDFIYASEGTTYIDGNGLRVRIERLAPNTAYGVTIWSFDAQSPGPRVSDWTETASGSPLVITNGYTFDGTVLPAADGDATLGALLTSSATGVLQIEARKHPNDVTNTVPQVFINALRLVANPAIHLTKAQIVGGNLRLTVEGQYPGQLGHFEQRTDLTGAWTPVMPVAVEFHGPNTLADFPLSSGSVFFRVVSP